MVKIELTRKTINISVTVRTDQFEWLKKNKLNKSKLFQNALDSHIKKSGSKKTSKT